MSQLKPKGWIDEDGCLHATLESAEFNGQTVTPLYALPEGYVLVPVEPTQAMFEAGRTSASGSCAEKLVMASYWRAMLAAAQEVENAAKS